MFTCFLIITRERKERKENILIFIIGLYKISKPRAYLFSREMENSKLVWFLYELFLGFGLVTQTSVLTNTTRVEERKKKVCIGRWKVLEKDSHLGEKEKKDLHLGKRWRKLTLRRKVKKRPALGRKIVFLDIVKRLSDDTLDLAPTYPPVQWGT